MTASSRSTVALWLASMAGVALVSLVPMGKGVSPYHIDKMVHFLAYAWLAFLPSRNTDRLRTAFIYTFAAMGYGLFMECAQTLVRSRHFDLWDILANNLGALAGLALARRIRPRTAKAEEHADD